MAGGGARGGEGSSGDDSDAEGTGFGGDAISSNGEPGGQELGIASGGTTTTGGSSQGDGEITITYKASSTTSGEPPKAPSSLSVELG